MKNYVITNAYLNTPAFESLKNSLKSAFDYFGEQAEFLTNDKAYALCCKNGKTADLFAGDNARFAGCNECGCCGVDGRSNEFITGSNEQVSADNERGRYDKSGMGSEFAAGENLQICDGKSGRALFFDKDINLCKLLEKRGYRSINSSKVIEICDDKAKTFVELYGKVPSPETVIAPFTFANIGYTDLSFLDEVEKLGYPLILKNGKGSFGKQVFLINNRAELQQKVKEFAGESIVFQKFIEESRGRDVRVYVVGGRAVACAERYNKDDFRSNVQSGGKMTAININDSNYKEFVLLAEKTAKMLGADFAGVDILYSNECPLVCEVNSNAHFAGLTKATGIDVARCIVKYFLGK